MFFLLLFSLFYYKIILYKKNKDKVSFLEQKLLWKIPDFFKILFPLVPFWTTKILKKHKNKLIEKQLVQILNELIPLSDGGISCFETLENLELENPLKNEIDFLLIYSKQESLKAALEYKVRDTNHIFLKQFWHILLRYLLSGGSISNKLVKLRKSILLKINIIQKINAKLLNNKIQLILCIIVPYIMFLIMNIIIPQMFYELINSKIGIFIFISSQIMHIFGILIFIKISKFNYEDELKNAMFINYIAFSLENGYSFYEAFNDVYYLLNLKKENIENKKTSIDLLKFLLIYKNRTIINFAKILIKNIEFGLESSMSLANLYVNIIEKLEYKVLIFEQKLPSLTLIPLFIFIFPASYILILSPIIIELFK